MDYLDLNPRQVEILEYIKTVLKDKGYTPTVREICDAVHLSSTSTVHFHLKALEKKGYIRRDPLKSRAIEVINEEDNLLLEDNYFDINSGIHKVKIIKGEPKGLKVRSVYDIR